MSSGPDICNMELRWQRTSPSAFGSAAVYVYPPCGGAMTRRTSDYRTKPSCHGAATRWYSY
eukprot:4550001-Pleurochrysis_carterae.AAC.1